MNQVAISGNLTREQSNEKGIKRIKLTGKAKDITGQRYGNLIALSASHLSKHKTVIWKFKCDCGDEYFNTINAAKLVGHCGCLTAAIRAEKCKKHGMAKTPTYDSWAAMIGRCRNKNDQAYDYYGGRGIKVCDEWSCFPNFYRDMGDRPPEMTLDRIDANGNYEPGNCRWASRKTQQRNQRKTHYITKNGESLCLTEWCERLGLKFSTVKGRIVRGWPLESALSKPVNSKFRNRMV